MVSAKIHANLYRSTVRKALHLYHPQWQEIRRTVRTLQKIGVDRRIIAGSLNLKGLKSFCGCGDWSETDIMELF